MRACFPACGGVGAGGAHAASVVGFAVAIHVAGVWQGHLSAVETVQETSGDLRHHGSVWDGLGHAVDRSLKQQEDTREFTTAQVSVAAVMNLEPR